MKTGEVQAIHFLEAVRLRAHIWPNKLGFDKGGWQYSAPDGKTWHAAYFGKGYSFATKVGTGSSPEEAKKSAKNVF